MDSGSTKGRLPYVALLVAALVAWWVSDHQVVPWVQRVAGYDRIHDRDLSVLLGHWVFGQLPRVLICVAVWLAASRFGLMPSLRRSLASGGSWRRVATTGLIATAIFLVVTAAIGAAADGTFGFHPYFPKMAGDLVSNMYEEVVAAAIGSSAVFAVGHEQYSIALRVIVGAVGVIFVYPWVASRSLWAPWIPHTLGDIIGDTILEL